MVVEDGVNPIGGRRRARRRLTTGETVPLAVRCSSRSETTECRAANARRGTIEEVMARGLVTIKAGQRVTAICRLAEIPTTAIDTLAA